MGRASKTDAIKSGPARPAPVSRMPIQRKCDCSGSKCDCDTKPVQQQAKWPAPTAREEALQSSLLEDDRYPQPEEPNQSDMPVPVMWGLDTSQFPAELFVSVIVPGQQLDWIAHYLYGSPAAISELIAVNGELPSFVPAGRSLRAPTLHLTNEAQEALDQQRQSGTLLRSAGLPVEPDGESQMLMIEAAGTTFYVTAVQYRALLASLAASLLRRANILQFRAEADLSVRSEYLSETNRAVRWWSDLLVWQDVPDASLWVRPRDVAVAIAAEMSGQAVTPDSIQRNTALLLEAQYAVRDAEGRWRNYIGGSVTGAGYAVAFLKFTRDASFSVSAALAGGAVAGPLAAAGSVTPAGALGVAAASGGLWRTTLEVSTGMARELDEVAGAFRRGALDAGLFRISGPIAQTLERALARYVFAKPSIAALTRVERVAVGGMTNATVGAGSSVTGVTAENLPAIITGDMSFNENLRSLGLPGAIGAGFGLAMGIRSGFREPPKVPFRSTPDSDATAKELIEILDEFGGVRKNNRRVIQVHVHSDGSISAGISGKNAAEVAAIRERILEHLPPGWRFGGVNTEKQVSGLGMLHAETIEGSFVPRSTCAECSATVIARESSSPIVGSTTLQWKGKPTRFTDPVSRRISQCPSCSANSGRILEGMTGKHSIFLPTPRVGDQEEAPAER